VPGAGATSAYIAQRAHASGQVYAIAFRNEGRAAATLLTTNDASLLGWSANSKGSMSLVYRTLPLSVSADSAPNTECQAAG
jgi:hypothetical protein